VEYFSFDENDLAPETLHNSWRKRERSAHSHSNFPVISKVNDFLPEMTESEENASGVVCVYVCKILPIEI